jgi:dihydroorotate dehydrogenase electron transfer subunit
MKQGIVPVLQVREPRPGYFEMTLAAPWIAVAALPGQFVHVAPGDGYHPLLRRPISVYDTDRVREVSILFRVEGEGTRMIAKKTAADSLDVLGPQGRGFRIDGLSGETVFLIGGGIGIPPIFFLSKTLQASGQRHEVLLGARGREHLIGVDRFEKIGIEVQVASDDGSVGDKGFVTDLLKNIGDDRARVYACGPTPMLKTIARLCREYPNVRAQLSLEERMSCALGACMGCVVKTVRGYERVCKEGPVFDAEDLVW